MMRRYGSPYAVVAAMVAALYQSGCATDDGGGSPEQLENAEASGDRGDDRPGDGGGGHDDDGHDDDDGGHDDGDDGHDDDGGDDGGGDEDGGDGGDTCPLDPCEGILDGGLFVVTDCGTLFPIESSIDFTCAGALERCQDLAADDPYRSILCEWLGDSTSGPVVAELFRQEADPSEPQCDALNGPPPCEPPSPPRCEIPCGEGPGTYRGFYCDGGAPFVEREGIGCQAALGNCALAAALNPDKDIVCEFNGEEIFRREVNEGSCVPEHGQGIECDVALPATCEGTHACTAGGTGLYLGEQCGGTFSIRTPGRTCEEALGNCILGASLDLTRSVRCQWNGEEIYRNEAEEGACEEEFGPVCEAQSP